MNGSREVDWFRVWTFVRPLLRRTCPYPGTPAWAELSDHDPDKIAAVLLAGVLWALNEDARQDASVQASHAISAAADWHRIAGHIYDREQFYRQKPWLRRKNGAA